MTQIQNSCAATSIDFGFSREQAERPRAVSFTAGVPQCCPIPWPTGTAPEVLPDEAGPALPNCDVLIVTYAEDAANAMAALLTPGHRASPPHNGDGPGWLSYTNDFLSYIPDLLPGSSPALEAGSLGYYKLIQLGRKRVLCFKSNLRLARDKPSMPLMRLIQQIIAETGASLVITTGGASGIGPAIQMGDAAITTEARFDLGPAFAGAAYNGTTVSSSFSLLDPSYLNLVNSTLIALNSGFLKSSPMPPARTPRIEDGPTVFGQPNVCVTTDVFLPDAAAASYRLQGLGCMADSDDAVVALALDEIGEAAPDWVSIRNASGPPISADAIASNSGETRPDYGFYTNLSSVLGCWAAILGS